MTSNNHSYYHSLELEGINCFKDKQRLDLSDGKGNFSKWTIILGDNGIGKTTLLRVLDRMQPINKENDNKISSRSGLSNTYFKSEQYNISLSLIEQQNIVEFTASASKNSKFTFLSVSELLTNNFLLSYGASRRMSKNPNISQKESTLNKFTSLFDDSIELINAEEWFLQKEMISLKANEKTKIKYKNDFELVKNILIDILPNVLDIRVKEINETNSKLLLEVQINENEWIHIRDLSFGYQTLTALIVDIAANMMEQYPESDNPLAEPVIILIDEIDLHLHPKWQRTVIEKLSHHFPNAQFIATSHSPLIVQAAQDQGANIVVCRKEGDQVIIDNNPDEVKGWRIDQILTSDLFETDSSRSIGTQENIDNYVKLKGKSNLSNDEQDVFENLIPKVKSAFPETILDEKLLQFAEKYLK